MVTSTDANNSPVQSAAPLLAEHAKNAGFASVSAMIEAIFEVIHNNICLMIFV